MRVFLQFLITFIITSSVFAQYGKITGYVTDTQTGDPLIGANIIVEGTTTGAATNEDGYYVILNVLSGTYTLRASLIGYNSATVLDVRVNIDQTTNVDIKLSETAIEVGEIVVIAQEPVVHKDVSYSRVNLNAEEIQNLPVVNAQSVVGLQAGIRTGQSGKIYIRGRDAGDADQTAFMLNGQTLRDERDNTPYTGISYTAIEDIQIQTGGFNAEYGNIRSGLVNVVTKEGKRDKYSFSFVSRYSPAAPKHFGSSPNDPNSLWIRPYLDPDVCWNGTAKGNWDAFTQRQYPSFEGWLAVSERTLTNDDPTDDLTPQAAQRLFLWQHRRSVDITEPDYDVDMTFAGPVPQISKYLGNLRFSMSYRRSQNMYVIPLATDGYYDGNFQFKLTSDVATGMKFSVDGLWGTQRATNISRVGLPGLFYTTSDVADVMDNGQFTNSRIFSPSYFSPSRVKRNMQGAKFTHAISSSSFYEITLTRFESKYDTNPDRYRDTSLVYPFGNSLYTDEAPFGFFDGSYDFSTGINGIRTTIGFGDSRDSSRIITYTTKFDFVSQLDQYNHMKAGAEFVYSDNATNYASFDAFLPDAQYQSKWHKFPVRAGLYIQDKMEFEGMVANVGLRLDYSHAGGDWYEYSLFTSAFSEANANMIDEILVKTPTKKLLYLSPRLGVAFPITENSKLYFNYGHFRQMPDPNNLYLVRIPMAIQSVTRIANPNNPLPRTIQYELGYEQNLFDQFLIRLNGYYKDNSLQPRLVEYINRDGSVDYNVSEPNSYSDIRGFEASLTKNRGSWIQGFVNYTYQVTSYGIFDYTQHYENPVLEREYQINYEINNNTFPNNRINVNRKPKPAPYSRFNIDLFTPDEFGPNFAGIYPLGEWRINLLGSWSSGVYDTWVGGGSQSGVIDNVKWKDYYNMDIRISKNFKMGPVNLQFFVDIANVFNFKYMNDYAWFDGEDRKAYFNSLQLSREAFEDFSKNTDGSPRVPWSNTTDPSYYEFGDDQPGDYRIGEYIPWDPNASEADKAKWRENKSYIDMPNQSYLAFLNPRDIFWGLKLNLELF